MKRPSSAGSPLRYSSLSSPGRKTACRGLPPWSAWIHPSTVLSTVRVQSPTPIASQIRVGQFNHDAANIFICEEIVPRKLHFIKKAVCVEKERIAAPAKEKTVVTGFRH